MIKETQMYNKMMYLELRRKLRENLKTAERQLEDMSKNY